MPPVISTIVMLRLFAQRQRASMSAYFTNSLTPLSRLDLLASLRSGLYPGRAARGSVAPRKWPAVLPRENMVSLTVQGHRLAHRGGGSAGRCPFLIGSGNGRQDARPCFAHRHVAAPRRRRPDFGLPDFGFGLFC